jgi:hypothetical protein
MSSLLVFNRVYRLETQSVILVFSTGFVKHCPSNLLPGYLSPLPPSPFPVYTVYGTVHTYAVCKGGEYWVKGGEGASDR